jgi:hypothetical protein
VLDAPDLPADDRLSGKTNDTASDPHRYLDIRPISRRQIEPEAGLEPAAHALQERCSTN